MTEINFRLDRKSPDCIRVRVFVGDAGQPLQGSGCLLLTAGEYGLLACAIRIGIGEMRDHLILTTEGEKAALEGCDAPPAGGDR